jgi:hydroxyversicolorone monooxygenase
VASFGPGLNLKLITCATENRRVKVICVGAGISGIMNAYQIQKHCEKHVSSTYVIIMSLLIENDSVEFVIYEKNYNMGGTWLVNRYPECACDIPSHAYAFNFALNVG